MESHHFLVGNTFSNGGFSIVILVFRGVTSLFGSKGRKMASIRIHTKQTYIIMAHLRLALFPKRSFEFSGILHVGPTKGLTFSPGDLRGCHVI